MIIELLTMGVIIAIGVLAYAIGHSTGEEKGYTAGLHAGRTVGVQQWQQVLETKRLAPTVESVRFYNWRQEGI